MNINDFFKVSPELFSKPQEEGIYKEKLVLKPKNEYLVRLLPYLKEGREESLKKTFFRFWTYVWRSVTTGNWTYVSSPKTWGERCPITDFYFKAKNSNDPSVLEKLKGLSYKEGCYYNVYVVDDPTNPANNGTVKILQASKQLNNVIVDAIMAGSDPRIKAKYLEEFDIEDMQNAIFDLSPNGINLCIDVQDQQGFANYSSSRFNRRRRDLGLSAEDIENAYNSVFDLTSVDRRLSAEEVEKLFCETFLGLSHQPSDSPVEETRTVTIPRQEAQVSQPVVPSPNVGQSTTEELNLDDLEQFLAEQDINS